MTKQTAPTKERQNNYMETEMNLADVPSIPDMSGYDVGSGSEPFVNGWYAGTVLGTRTSTDKNGNERVFESGDEPSQNTDSRNIRLQIVVKRKSDGRSLNARYLVNYRPEDLTAETIATVTAHQAKVKAGEEWGSLFRPFASLRNLSELQKIAGVRQFQRNGNGGLDIHGLFGKNIYVRLADDDRNPQYKQIKEIRSTERAPKTLL